SKALVAAKSAGSVIPPAKHFLGLLKQPKRIAKAQLAQARQCRALGRRAHDLAAPRVGGMDVAVVGLDVEVADDEHLRMASKLGGELRSQRREPFELVAVLVRVDALTVRQLQAEQAHAAQRRAEN